MPEKKSQPIVDGTNYSRSGTGPQSWSECDPIIINLTDPIVKCSGCNWSGRRSQSAPDELSDRIVDLCPECGADCE